MDSKIVLLPGTVKKETFRGMVQTRQTEPTVHIAVGTKPGEPAINEKEQRQLLNDLKRLCKRR